LERAVLGGLNGKPVAVTASYDGEIRVWDLRSAEQTGTALTSQVYGVRALALGPQGSGTAVIATGDREVNQQTRLWSLTTFQQLGDALTGRGTDVRSLALADVGGMPVLITAGWDATVRLLDLRSGRLRGAVLNGHLNPVSSAAVADLDGPVAVTTGYDKTARVWDLRTQRQRFHWAHTGYGTVVVTSRRQGRPIVVVASGSSLHVWDLASRSVLGELTGHTGEINALDKAELDGTPVLLSGANDNTARLWDLDALQPLGPALPGDEGAVRAVALSSGDGGLTAFTGDSDGIVRAWDPVTGASLRTAVPRLERDVSVLFSGEVHGRPVLAIGGDSGTVLLWCRETEQVLVDLQLATNPQDLLLTPEGYLCVATAMGVVALHVAEWAAGGGA
jgi:WD40 repeat protein